LIPNLARIDAAGCLSLSSIPFAVCRTPSSLDGTNGVNIQRTPVAKVLDWSNQSNVESSSIATACIVSWATSLTSLDISHNNISEFDLPQRFGFIQQLQQLSHLNVGHNRIGAIQPSILDIIRNVKHVNFHHNPIEKVNLSGESSDVAIRLLRSLGNTANCLSDLREVQMNGIKGNFTAVMEAFHGGFLTCYRASLTKIRLDDNSKSNFTFIAANFLGGLPNLEFLSISGNWQLVSIKPKAFSGLSSLNTLYLTNNRLVSLDGAFIGMISLQGLFLYKNVLTSIDADAMEGLSSLKRLDLQENKISSIAQGAFSNMISLKTLHLWRNSKGPDYCPINSCNKALKEVNQSGWGLPAGASVSVL
jgi:Leucine-rich repeat (LRR) protein